jgi:hypothetical protein
MKGALFSRPAGRARTQASGASNSSERTVEETHAARYWAEHQPATWSRIFRTLSAQQD